MSLQSIHITIKRVCVVYKHCIKWIKNTDLNGLVSVISFSYNKFLIRLSLFNTLNSIPLLWTSFKVFFYIIQNTHETKFTFPLMNGIIQFQKIIQNTNQILLLFIRILSYCFAKTKDDHQNTQIFHSIFRLLLLSYQ